jgi:uncharacterized protein (DUF4415 family)
LMNKRKLIYPTPEEDASITAAALGDPDAQPLSDEDFKRMKPIRLRGRPAGSGTKVQLTLQVDSDVVETFKRQGDGWQTKMNAALRQWLEEHKTTSGQ